MANVPMITHYENILGKCFRRSSCLNKSNNFTSDTSKRMPPTILFSHYLWRTNQQSRPRVLSFCSVLVFSPQAHACNTQTSSKQRFRIPLHNEVQIHSPEKMTRAIQMLIRKGGPTVLGRNPITSHLTAQLQHTLLALESPRLLTPDLPSH